MAPRGLLVIVAALSMACAARSPVRPAGAAVEDAEAVKLFQGATRACAQLTTFTAAMTLSGRAGGERLRGRLHAGFAAPASVRLEAVAPFGQPVFILAAQRDEATLLFPRDKRVLASVKVADVLARLTGVDLGAEDLRLVLSGCLAAGQTPGQGRQWPGGWKAVTLGPDRTSYLRQQDGTWRVVAADEGPWRIDYAAHMNDWPRTVRIRSAATGGDVDLTAQLEQLQTNITLPPDAFTVEVPPDAERLSLSDLRSVAPLREKS
jgi:outer membrane biogenesis lipoprotein LolB